MLGNIETEQIFGKHAALHQAGRHMEDSIVAAYSALLLGILSKHNQVHVYNNIIKGIDPYIVKFRIYCLLGL